MILHKALIAPYSLELWVIITDNPHKDVPHMNVKYPGLRITWTDDMAAWTNDHIWENVICVTFHKKHFEPDTVAHEAVHVVNMIYDYSGIRHDPKNDEPQAYLTGWIVGEIHRAAKMKNKK